jgi:hypothetical protein
VGTRLPKNLIAGIITNHEKTPPAKIVPATFGPMMKPTPRYSDVVFARSEEPGSQAGL